MYRLAFRFYDVKRKQYADYDDFWITQDGAWATHKCSKYASYSKDDILIEAYIGRCDRNSKPIYEGDLLLGVFGTAGRGATGRREKTFVSRVVWSQSGWNLSADGRYTRSPYRWYPTIEECLIWGNTHDEEEPCRL